MAPGFRSKRTRSDDLGEGIPPVAMKRVRKGLIAKGLGGGRCAGVSVRSWK